jgi:hypothetical protein
MVEHRWGRRINTAIDVLLFRGQRYAAQGKVFNAGFYGIFVATDQIFPTNTYLEVRFTLVGDSYNSDYRIPGIVVHTANNGIGLMADTTEPAARLGLKAILDEATAKEGKSLVHGSQLLSSFGARL